MLSTGLASFGALANAVRCFPPAGGRCSFAARAPRSRAAPPRRYNPSAEGGRPAHPIMGKTPSLQLGSLGKKSKKKPQLAEGDGGSAGPGGSGAEDEYKAALALSKRLDAEAAAGPWKAVQLQKGDEGYNFNTRFKQQRYKVNTAPWQSPLFMLAFGLLVGVVFLSFGGVMLETAEGLHVVRKVYDCFHEDAKHEGECACDGMASCTTPLEVRPGWTVLTQREPSP